MFASLEAEACAWFDAERVAESDRKITRVALLRYEGQGSELAIAWPGDVDAAKASFAQAHQALNGFTLEAEVELVTLRVEAEGQRARIGTTGTGARSWRRADWSADRA